MVEVPAVARVASAEAAVSAVAVDLAEEAVLAAAEDSAGGREGVEDVEGLATGTAIRLSSGIGGPTTTGLTHPCFIGSAIRRSMHGLFQSPVCWNPKRPTAKTISDSAPVDRCRAPMRAAGSKSHRMAR